MTRNDLTPQQLTWLEKTESSLEVMNTITPLVKQGKYSWKFMGEVLAVHHDIHASKYPVIEPPPKLPDRPINEEGASWDEIANEMDIAQQRKTMSHTDKLEEIRQKIPKHDIKILWLFDQLKDLEPHPIKELEAGLREIDPQERDVRKKISTIRQEYLEGTEFEIPRNSSAKWAVYQIKIKV